MFAHSICTCVPNRILHVFSIMLIYDSIIFILYCIKIYLLIVHFINFIVSCAVVVDTNRWYHQTYILPGNISITIGTEYH